MTKTIRFVSRYMGTIRYKKRCMLIKTIQYDSIRFDTMRCDAMQFNNWKHWVVRKQWTSFSNIFLSVLVNIFLPTSEKISAGFMNAWKCVLIESAFSCTWTCIQKRPASSFLGHASVTCTGSAKATSETDQNHFKASTSKPRPNFTREEVEVVAECRCVHSIPLCLYPRDWVLCLII